MDLGFVTFACGFVNKLLHLPTTVQEGPTSEIVKNLSTMFFSHRQHLAHQYEQDVADLYVLVVLVRHHKIVFICPRDRNLAQVIFPKFSTRLSVAASNNSLLVVSGQKLFCVGSPPPESGEKICAELLLASASKHEDGEGALV